MQKILSCRLLRCSYSIIQQGLHTGLVYYSSPNDHAISVKKMAQASPVVLGLLASAAAVSTEAGKIIRDVLSRGNLGIIDKGDKSKFDPQTEADRRSQAVILSRLKLDFPNVTIIGEEDDTKDVSDTELTDISTSEANPEILKIKCPEKFLNIKEEEITVWVDPLDGTTEFTEGIVEAVTVLIGIAIDGKSIAGVIHQPFPAEGRTLWALEGWGVGGFTPKCPPNDLPYTVATTRSHSSPLVQEGLDALAPENVLRVGGAGHKVMLLLEGRAHVYLFASPGCKKWDTCAPEIILREAGGELTNVHGKKYNYLPTVQKVNSAGVVATAVRENHQEIIKRLPQTIKDRLK